MKALISDGTMLGVRAFTHLRRNPASMVSAIVMPLLFFGLFQMVMRRIMAARGFDYTQLLPPTIIIQAMLFAAMSSAYFIAGDKTSGIMARFRSLPLHPLAPLVGRSASDVARSFVSLVVLLVVSVAAGMRFGAGWQWLPLYVLVALLFALSAALVMGLVGYQASSPEAASSIASIPYLPLIMLSNGFAPVEDFPGWLQPFVRYQPVSSAIDALRALAGDGEIGPTVTRSLAWSVGLSIVFAVVGARQFRKVSA